MPKFRHHKVKREHAVLPAIEAGLALLAGCEAVGAVIPGTIRRKRGGATGWSVQYETGTGLKFLARSPSAVQEVFVVSADPEAVIRFVLESGLVPRSGAGAAPLREQSSPPATETDRERRR